MCIHLQAYVEERSDLPLSFQWQAPAIGPGGAAPEAGDECSARQCGWLGRYRPGPDAPGLSLCVEACHYFAVFA